MTGQVLFKDGKHGHFLIYENYDSGEHYCYRELIQKTIRVRLRYDGKQWREIA